MGVCGLIGLGLLSELADCNRPLLAKESCHPACGARSTSKFANLVDADMPIAVGSLTTIQFDSGDRCFSHKYRRAL
jgi:hypothetical protein